MTSPFPSVLQAYQSSELLHLGAISLYTPRDLMSTLQAPSYYDHGHVVYAELLQTPGKWQGFVSDRMLPKVRIFQG